MGDWGATYIGLGEDIDQSLMLPMYLFISDMLLYLKTRVALNSTAVKNQDKFLHFSPV